MAIVLRGNGESTFSDDVGIDGTITNDLTVADGLTLTDGNLVVANGHGIDFSADGNNANMTSELLDDYEEGTWTATVVDSAGNTATFDANQSGFAYTKIGRVVTISSRINLTSKNGLTANQSLRIDGLPFDPVSIDSLLEYQGSATTSAVTYNANAANVTARLNIAAAQVNLNQSISGEDRNNVTWNNVDDAAFIGFTLTYFTAA